MGLGPAPEYTLILLVMPVGDYYKGGLAPQSAILVEDYDRAAPLGVGSAKCGGNYAADMQPNQAAKAAGYPIMLYPDARTRTFVEEFSTSNFFAITADGKKYVTPKSRPVRRATR